MGRMNKKKRKSNALESLFDQKMSERRCPLTEHKKNNIKIWEAN